MVMIYKIYECMKDDNIDVMKVYVNVFINKLENNEEV